MVMRAVMASKLECGGAMFIAENGLMVYRAWDRLIENLDDIRNSCVGEHTAQAGLRERSGTVKIGDAVRYSGPGFKNTPKRLAE